MSARPAAGRRGVRWEADRSAGPVRTCVGCRERAERSALLRVVAVEVPGGHVLVPDPGRRLPGRGASLHPDPRCVDLAERRRAMPRALRVPAPLDLSPVREAVAQLQEQRRQEHDQHEHDQHEHDQHEHDQNEHRVQAAQPEAGREA